MGIKAELGEQAAADFRIPTLELGEGKSYFASHGDGRMEEVFIPNILEVSQEDTVEHLRELRREIQVIDTNTLGVYHYRGKRILIGKNRLHHDDINAEGLEVIIPGPQGTSSKANIVWERDSVRSRVRNLGLKIRNRFLFNF